MDQRRGLQYTDGYLLRLFREADKDYTRGVKYEALLAGGESSPGGAHFPPEFTKPKVLRGSQIQAPWEWKANPVVEALVAQQQLQRTQNLQSQRPGTSSALLASSAQTLQRLGTAQAGGRGGK